MGDAFLEVRGLDVHFATRRTRLGGPQEVVRAIDDLDLDIRRGETYALVGESGSGKTTLGRAILGLVRPTSGAIRFDGGLLPPAIRQRELRLRSAIQPIFQDVAMSLNPRRKIAASVMDPLVVNRVGTRRERHRRVGELLEMVELPGSYARRYPHELSGGERQRVGIARALALRPRMLVLDEPTSALDVSVQAKVAELLRDIQAELELTYLLISHDLALVRNVATRVGVMYLGRLMEQASVETMFADPRNPYTACLLGAVPDIDEWGVDGDHGQLRVREGDLPGVGTTITGCAFYSRCPSREDVCAADAPALRPMGSERHVSRCHFDAPTGPGLPLPAGSEGSR